MTLEEWNERIEELKDLALKLLEDPMQIRIQAAENVCFKNLTRRDLVAFIQHETCDPIQ